MDVKEHPSRYSLVYLEQPFIVPGGRFRELYYWDSYWTILGLLVSKMNQTVKGDVLNTLSFAYVQLIGIDATIYVYNHPWKVFVFNGT